MEIIQRRHPVQIEIHVTVVKATTFYVRITSRPSRQKDCDMGPETTDSYIFTRVGKHIVMLSLNRVTVTGIFIALSPAAAQISPAALAASGLSALGAILPGVIGASFAITGTRVMAYFAGKNEADKLGQTYRQVQWVNVPIALAAILFAYVQAPFLTALDVAPEVVEEVRKFNWYVGPANALNLFAGPAASILLSTHHKSWPGKISLAGLSLFLGLGVPLAHQTSMGFSAYGLALLVRNVFNCAVYTGLMCLPRFAHYQIFNTRIAVAPEVKNNLKEFSKWKLVERSSDALILYLFALAAFILNDAPGGQAASIGLTIYLLIALVNFAAERVQEINVSHYCGKSIAAADLELVAHWQYLARRYANAGITVATGVSAAYSILTFTIPKQIVSAFIDVNNPSNQATTNLAIDLVRITGVNTWLDTTQQVTRGALSGIKRFKKPTLVNLASFWPVFVVGMICLKLLDGDITTLFALWTLSTAASAVFNTVYWDQRSNALLPLPEEPQRQPESSIFTRAPLVSFFHGAGKIAKKITCANEPRPRTPLALTSSLE